MKGCYGRNAAYVVVALAALFLSSASCVRAQTSPGALRSERERIQRQMDQNYRSPIAYPKPSLYGGAPSAREIRLAAARRIKKEAERIRFLSDEMMRAAAPDAPLDFKAIAKSASELRKSALRLGLDLALPELDEAKKSQGDTGEFDGEELVASLSKLNLFVRGLSASPLVGMPGVLDAKQASSAGRDLEAIIILSDKIRRSAKKLGQTASRR